MSNGCDMKTSVNFELLKAMNVVVGLMNDESAEEIWLMAVPDGADDDDLHDIAGDDELMDSACHAFRNAVSLYGAGGWYTTSGDVPPFDLVYGV